MHISTGNVYLIGPTVAKEEKKKKKKKTPAEGETDSGLGHFSGNLRRTQGSSHEEIENIL